VVDALLEGSYLLALLGVTYGTDALQEMSFLA
jgi:hypothetical protein